MYVINPAQYQASSANPAYVWVPYSQLEGLPQKHKQRAFIERAQNRLQTLGDFAKIENTDHEVTFNSDASEAICDYAQTNNTDLIVVGSHGRHGLMCLFTHTIAETVINKAPCDVNSVHLQVRDQ